MPQGVLEYPAGSLLISGRHMKVYGFPESSREGAGVLRRPKEAQKYSVDSMGFKFGLTELLES